MGGVFDGFVQQRLMPMIDTSGAVWRWREGDPVAAAMNPATPETLARAVKLRELLAAGLPIKVSIASFGSGIGTVEVASGGTRYRFTPQDNKPRPLIWSATGSLPEASVVLYGAGAAPATANADAAPGVEALRVETEGPWALFRLMDRADKQNAGAQAIRAAFGEGAQRTVLKVELPGTTNPFSRAGIWSFRCPASL